MKSILFILSFFPLLLFSQTSLNANLLFNWQDSSLLGSSIFDNVYNEIWGFVQNDKEFAVIGSTSGTHIFDVSDPVNSVQVSFIAGKSQGPQIIHRDFHDHKGYLYIVCDEGSSSLQIVDVSNLPDTAITVYDSDEFFERAHNIFIDTLNAKMYTSNGTIYSLDNPEQPTLLYQNSVLSSHDMYVKDDTAYINSKGNGLVVVDFSQTTLENQNHQEIGSLLSYPQKGYNHSGWLSEDGNYYIMADENWGLDMKMLDVSDLSNIEVVSFISSGIDENSIPHNQIINGDFVYTAYYHDGLYVHNISNPLYPYLIAYYDTFTPDHHDSYMGAWGVYPLLPSGNILVSDMQTGLYVIDIDYESAGVENELENKINIYPNPSNDFITVDLNESFFYEIYDLQSKKVSSASAAQNNQIDLSGLNTGIYILKITTNSKVYTQKIFKK
jgi:choice-of-anchor B domain-containing protein